MEKPPTPSELVGRDPELAQIDTVLERHLSGLVVVAGEPGIGKTSLLREVESHACKRGWKTARGDGQQKLSIDPHTTETDFRSRVQELLKISANESFSEKTPDFGVILSSQASDLSSKSDQPDQPLIQSSLRHLDPLVDQLRHRSPVLLLVDGYRPEAHFANWFAHRFSKDIKQAGAPIVVVVADQARDVAMLKALADKSISLGPLHQSSIRLLLETIGERITPPMAPAELEEYASQVCKQPEILGSLKNVLTLVQTGDP